MRFRVEPGPRGNWRVMLEGADAPLSEHDTEEEAQERLASYARGVAAASAPTVETGIARGERVRVRDGSEIIIRAVTAEDKALLLAGWERLGEASRYRRFMAAKRNLSVAELAYFTEVDHVCHEAIGAIDPATGAGAGIARWIRPEPGSDTAEVAIVIADEWQGRGVGAALLSALAERARTAGITEFTASQLSDNRAMLTLFEHIGKVTIEHVDGPALFLRIALTTAC